MVTRHWEAHHFADYMSHARRSEDGTEPTYFQIFRDTPSTTYENILALDTVKDFQVPKDYFSALNKAA